MKENKRTSISDATLKSELRKLFSKGVTQKTDAYEQLRTSHTMGRSRFWRMYDLVHAEWARLKDKAEVEGMTQATKEATRNGLKTKQEKQMDLQNEISNIDRQIRGEVEFTFIVGNKINRSHLNGNFMLPVQVQDGLRAKKLQYIAELNKMAGDYAPAKIEHSGGISFEGFLTNE